MSTLEEIKSRSSRAYNTVFRSRFGKFPLAWAIPIVLLPLLIFSKGAEGKAAYVLFVMALYWLTETLPLPITALIPLVLFPIFGVMSSKDAAESFMNESLMLFLASLIAATTVERSNLHNRISLKVLLIFGTSPKWLLLGFMMNTMFLSMWISNTATCALMVPIIDAVLVQLRHRTRAAHVGEARKMSIIDTLDICGPSVEDGRRHRSLSSIVPREDSDVDPSSFQTLRKSLYLGICYAANIGGTGVLTGTSPNLILYGLTSNKVEMDGLPNEITFSNWMMFNVPPMIICVFFAWLFIVFFFIKRAADPSADEKQNRKAIQDLIKQKYEKLGNITFQEKSVLILFILMILLWFFRNPEFLRGWATVLPNVPNGDFIGDSTPAFLVILLFALIPADPKNSKAGALLDWRQTQDKVAWNVVILVGGGFMLAEGSKQSGLSNWLGSRLAELEGLSDVAITLVVCLLSLVLTEITSNSATATVILPTVRDMALKLGKSPFKFMLPVTICCSYAFVLPIASGPNAIVFDAGDMKTKDMAFPGLVMKLICVAVFIVAINTWGPVVYDFKTSP